MADELRYFMSMPDNVSAQGDPKGVAKTGTGGSVAGNVQKLATPSQKRDDVFSRLGKSGQVILS
jgi:hypothetical protein